MSKFNERRQIPGVEKYCGSPLYNDIVYGYLQQISQFDIENKIRYVPFTEVTQIKLAEALKTSRPTIARRIKNLEDFGLIIKNKKKKRYEIIPLANPKDGTLIDKDVLKALVDTLSHHCISIYVYLLRRFKGLNGSFVCTLAQARGYIGLSAENRHNETVQNILWVLKKLDLIDYKKVTLTSDGGNSFATNYQIIQVNEQLPMVE